MEFVNYTLYRRAENVKRLKFIVDNLPNKPGIQLNILDIGCGNGNICYQLARCGHTVMGIDNSHDAIAAAIENFGNLPNLDFTVINAEVFHPDDKNKYDVIICSELLEHLSNPELLLDNFKNLLDVDGIAIVTVPNGNGPREVLITKPVQSILYKKGIISKFLKKIKLVLGYKGETEQTSSKYLDHLIFFSIKNLTQLAETKGFVITKKQSGNFIENVFPFSTFTRRILFLQKLDCFVADLLPLTFSSQFYTVWEQVNRNNKS